MWQHEKVQIHYECAEALMIQTDNSEKKPQNEPSSHQVALHENRTQDLLFKYTGFYGSVASIISLIWGFFLFDNQDSKIMFALGALTLQIICAYLLIYFIIKLLATNAEKIGILQANLEKSGLEHHREAESARKDIERKNDIINYKEKYINEKELMLNEVTKSIHGIFHYYRDAIYALHAITLHATTCIAENNKEPVDKYIHEAHSIYKDFLGQAMANLAQIFTWITGDQTAVCIKTVSPSKEPGEENIYRIKTLIRDPVSKKTREKSDFALHQSDGYYLHDRNTAFIKILDQHSETSKFINNDLANDPHYINGNKHSDFSWKDFYNACIVVPIRIMEKAANVVSHEQTSKISKQHRYYGMLCVDNKKGGFTESGLEILASVGDSLYNFFTVYHQAIESLETLKNMSKIQTEAQGD